VAKWQEEVVAAAVLLEQGSKFELKNIAVAKDWQGNGIANQLIEKTIFWESGSGATEIWVGTGNSSLNQLALYQNVAFE
jgi:GNAT superfamily N-acetyltransferase